ncbi:hypothetical protein RJ640_023080 [Escallonia rubra]|uniref:KIB1-4 beta-propeller domain-containing protein n=1 Tax=Escallonia rubra TaxID=112253 RepID=A0AA88RQA1_9ASTE|nr:hypothetical protein RJ640_023080 [Escallonia rubra]
MGDSKFGWAWLPRELLDLILDYVVEFPDYVRFCSVCTEWRLTALDEDNPGGGNHQLQKQRLCILKACGNKLPMLVFPTKDHSEDKRSFYSITDGKIYDLPLPLPYGRRFFGSSHGWLFTIEKSMAITLVNPFSGKTILLPEFKDPWEDYQLWLDNDEYERFPGKGILSSDPSLDPDSYQVAIIHLDVNNLACFKSGEKDWNFLKVKKEYHFSDVVYHNGLLHGVDSRGTGELVRVDDVTAGIETIIVPPRRNSEGIRTDYLVTTQEGDLLRVQRHLEDYDNEDDDWLKYRTSGFKVFKLAQEHSIEQVRQKWTAIESIGDQALFLGDSNSECVLASHFPGCKPNCIYYTEYYYNTYPFVPRGADDDVGMFNLETRTFGTHYVPDPAHMPLLPAIWIVPNLKG